MGNDFGLVVAWWAALFCIGLVGYPITSRLFGGWWDRGYLFSKAIGLVLVSYTVWLGASLHVLPFTVSSIVLVMGFILLLGALINGWVGHLGIANAGKNNKLQFTLDYAPDIFRKPQSSTVWRILILECFFFLAFLLWAWVKGHEPSVHGLEKFMDFGFAKSIQKSRYFPPSDMWYSGWTINYYYFGHYIMALLSLLSNVDLRYGFNLMLAALFGFTFTMSFSIGYQLILSNIVRRSLENLKQWKVVAIAIFGGLLTAYLVSFAANMQTLYAFTKGYTGENVKPFWELLWSPAEFPEKVQTGMNIYWYANATRFIPYTIHEFPSYSFVVSDVHGHVLSLPFVLLAIALLIQIFGRVRPWGRDGEVKLQPGKHAPAISEPTTIPYKYPLFFGLLTGVLFMTNVLDAPIYLGLFVALLALTVTPSIAKFSQWFSTHAMTFALALVAGPVVLPFVMKFKSFVSGLAINCPPAAFADKKIGLFLFETVDKCQKSPLWMMWLLWGFFIFCALWLFGFAYYYRNRGAERTAPKPLGIWRTFFRAITPTEAVLLVFFLYSLLLIIFPEFFYFKDIYPQHFRSNTMFKLGYQAFILFSFISGYAIVRILFWNSFRTVDPAANRSLRIWKIIFLVLLLPKLFLVAIYPNFSIKSYFGQLGRYQTLDGMAWLKNQYPDDYEAISWLDKKIRDDELRGTSAIKSIQAPPVIVEADSDSYTDFARVSTYTGAPTVIGWAVHEWLWHGTYDIVAPRRDDVAKIYEDPDSGITQSLLAKHDVSYIFVGQLEREKYKNLQEEKIAKVATPVYTSGETVVYRVNSAGY